MIRKIFRLIRSKPLVVFKRIVQYLSYKIIYALGEVFIFILRVLGLLRQRPFDKKSIKKILVLRPDRIGDVILATPTIQALRDIFPDAYIAMAVRRDTKTIVDSNPYLNEVIALKAGGLLGLYFDLPMIFKLRKESFDLALILYSRLWCNLLAVLCDVPHRVGYDFHANGAFLTVKVSCGREHKHEVEVNLDLLRALGIDVRAGQLHVSCLKEADDFIRGYTESLGINKDKGLVIIHPGSYEEYIRWSAEGFAKVAEGLMKTGRHEVILLAGPGEEELVKRTTAQMSCRPKIACGLTLAQTVCLIKRARLFIGNSTGTMHIAAALGVPMVAIFGNIHPLDSWQKWGPWSKNSIVVHKDVGCKDCDPASCRRYRCMEAVTPDDVIEAAGKLMGA